MSSLLRCVAFAILAGVTAAATAPLAAFPPLTPAAPAQPAAEDYATLVEKFQTERKEAIAGRFPPDALRRADDLAKRARQAFETGNLKTASRHLRDARWQLPYLPPSLPPHVVRVLGESRMRHSDRVNALAYGSDNRLASASRDGSVKIWDLGNGRGLMTYRGHAEQGDDPSREANMLVVGDVAFHPKGKSIASVGGNQVHQWDPATGKLIKVLFKSEKSDKPLRAIAFNPAGTQIAVGGEDGILRVVEVATGKLLMTSPVRPGRMEKVAFSPNGKLVGVVDQRGNVAIFAPDNPVALMSVAATDGGSEAMGIGFSADGSAIYTCGKDNKARLIAGVGSDGKGAGNTAVRLREFIGHTGSVTSLAVSGDGRLLVTGGDDKSVRIWEAASGKQLRMFQGHSDKLASVAIRPDQGQIASGSDDGAIRLWNLAAADDHRALKEAAEPLWAVAMSPDGEHLASAGADKTIRVYDPETGKLEATLSGHTAPITSLAFFPDSKRLAAAGGEHIIKIWDITTKKVVKELAGHESAVMSLAVNGGSRLLVSSSADKTVRGWNLETGVPSWSWSSKSLVCGVAIRKDGKTVAAGMADGGLVVLDVSAAKPKVVFTQPIHIAGVAAIAYSPDGTRSATVGGDGAVRVWTVSDDGGFTPLMRFEGQPKTGSTSGFSPLTAVGFSPDGRFIVTAGADMVVRIWDVQTKGEVRGLRGHTDWATGVAFSPDGRLLASVAVDKVVRVFELAPQESSGGTGHTLKINAVAVSPDGKTAATASADQTIKIWELSTGREITTLISNVEWPLALAFLGDNHLVLSAPPTTKDSGRLHYWSISPARLIHTTVTGEVYNVAGAMDGSKAAAWAARPVINETEKNTSFEMYAADGTLLFSINEAGRGITTAAFSTDLKWAAAGDQKGTVRLWDLEKKERIGGDWALMDRGLADLGLTADKKLLVAAEGLKMNPAEAVTIKVADIASRAVLCSVPSHKGGVRGVVAAPVGDTFLTFGAADREIKLWSLADPKAVKEIRSWKLPTAINAATYTPDGKQIVTANADGSAYVLGVD